MVTNLIHGANMLPEKPADSRSNSQPGAPGADPMVNATSLLATPIATLVAGPAAAMKNSARAEGGSRVRFATPPRRKSVIDETDMRKPRATIE